MGLSFESLKKINHKKSLIAALSLILVMSLPLFLAKVLSESWQEVFYRSATDISLLEWIGAFLKVFLALLFIEHFRQHRRIAYIYIASGFLIMGILNFFYSVNTPESNIAVWIKFSSMALGSVCFLFSIPARNKIEHETIRIILRYCMPSAVLAFAVAASVYVFYPFLPEAYLAESSTFSPFMMASFFAVGILFFASALNWLRLFFKEQRGEDLIFALMLLFFAQSALTVQFIKSWNPSWWSWHLSIILIVFLVTFYMLARCLRRSLVWRLVFSLGLTFGLTVLISSSIIQSSSEKEFIQKRDESLLKDHKLFLNSESFEIKNSNLHLRAVNRRIFSGVGEEKTITDSIKEEIQCLQYDSRGTIINSGIILHDEIYFASEEYPTLHVTDFIKEALTAFENQSNLSSLWTPFYFLSPEYPLVGTQVYPLRNYDNKIIGAVFNTVDMSFMEKTLFPANLLYGQYKLVFDKNTGRKIYSQLDDRLEETLADISEKEARESVKSFEKSIIADSKDVDFEGKYYSLELGENRYMIFVCLMPGSEWGVADIVDSRLLPASAADKLRYIFISVSLVILLLGFLLLLLLLNYQLANPLKRLIKATIMLKNGIFNVRINSGEKNEIGVLSNAFDYAVEQLSHLYDELSNTIKDRTVALKLLEKSQEARNIFFANISHELRTPLHGILSFSRIGMDSSRKTSPQKMIEYFECINESGERLMQLINELLDLAKLESRKVDLSRSPTNLFLLPNQVFSELKANFKEKNIDFECEKPKCNTTVNVDREQILRVYRNLIGNALKFSPENDKIKAEFLRKGEMLECRVIDNGPGIPEDQLEDIFDKFVQGNNHSKQGTGLGLPICKEIINLHGGEIYASNREEGGTVISFTIPNMALYQTQFFKIQPKNSKSVKDEDIEKIINAGMEKMNSEKD